MTSIRVFISYAWKDHNREEIGELARWLDEQEEIEVISDHAYPDNTYPEDGWQSWMAKSIENAGIVLCICGENFKKTFEKKNSDRDDAWEGAVVAREPFMNYYHYRSRQYIAVSPESGTCDAIPLTLKNRATNPPLTDRKRIYRCIKAVSAFSQFNHYCRTRNLPEARELFERMAELGDTPAVMSFRVKAAFNMILEYSKTGKENGAESLLHELLKDKTLRKIGL